MIHMCDQFNHVQAPIVRPTILQVCQSKVGEELIIGMFVPTEIKKLTLQNSKDKDISVSIPGSVVFKNIRKLDPTDLYGISFCLFITN
jgi:hypothetical protein